MQNQSPVRYVPLAKNTGELNVKNDGRTFYQFLIQNNTIVLEITKYSESRKTKSINGWFAGVDDKGNFYRKYISLTTFSIDKVDKVHIENIDGYKVYFRLACRRMISYGNISDTFFIDIPEENIISGSNIVNAIKLKVGSQFVPFPIGTLNSDINKYLPYHIINQYNQNQDENKDIYVNNKYGLILENGKCSFNARMTFDQSSINESQYFPYYVSDIYDILLCDMKNFIKLYYFQFTASFREFINLKGIIKNNNKIGQANNRNILIARNFKEQADKCYLLSILNPYTKINGDIKKLSEISQTKYHDELNEMVFNANHSTLIIDDDYNSSTYAKAQNDRKITELTELVIDNKPLHSKSTDNKYAKCNVVILSNRYLMDFNISIERYFMECTPEDLSKLKEQYSYDIIQKAILSLNLVITDYINDMLKDRDIHLNFHNNLIKNTKLNYNFIYNENFITLKTFFLLTTLINEILVKYIKIDITESLNDCINRLLEEKHLFESILQPDSILKSFKANLNQIPFDNETVRYDELSKSINNDIIYHKSEELLLFDQKKFYNLFLDEFLMSQTDYRKLLADNNYLVSNTKERNFYRLPIGNRKEYIAVPISLLNDEAIKLLPKKSIPPYEWIAEQQNYNIYLGNDANGFPIYWPVDKDLTNKFAVVLGNTGFGKTYWTTSILIKGLHDSGHNAIILDSNFIHNYSISELRKALPEDYIQDNFCFLSECELSDDSADEILDCYIQNRDRIFVIDTLDDKQRNEFITQLIKYQQECKETETNFEEVFMILDEANNEETFKSKALKYVYDQGRKLKISIITILQYFSGIKSENFRKQIFQANLKVVFQMNDATVGKLLNEYPGCPKDELKKRIFDLERGEAVVFGEFEQLDGKIKKSIFYKKAD